MVNNLNNGANIEYLKNNIQTSLFFNSKIELKESTYIQNILAKIDNNAVKGKDFLKCNCIPDKVDMYLSHRLDEKSNRKIFFLANLPNNGHKHSSNCLFYNHIEKLTDSNEKYRDLIFKDLEYLDYSKADEKIIEEHKEKNNHRKNTFNNFCTDFIGQSMSIAFNRINSLATKREDLKNPTYKDFLFSFGILMNKNELLSDGSIKKSLDSSSSFYYGIIEKSFLEILNNNNEKNYKITLPVVKKHFEDGKFSNYFIEDIDVKINRNTLESTAQLVKNFDRYITTPYFFIAIVKKNQFGKRIVRFYIKPVYSDEKYLVFVDSGYERNYAHKLIQNNIPFIKPIQNSCFNRVKKDFVNYERSENVYKRAFLQFIPDFIEFSKDEITITEVSGYTDEKYLSHLDRKEKHYLKESQKSKGLYKFKKIIGS